jgi:phage baseplate assembly protein W
MPVPLHIQYPLQPDSRGRTAAADDARHVRNLIEMFLFTAPGERRNRPEFGGGVMGLVFSANSLGAAETLQAMIQGGLQTHLGDLIELRNVSVNSLDERLEIAISYVLLRTGENRNDTFTRSLAS